MCTGRGRPEAKTSSARPRTSGSSAGSVTEWLKAVTFASRPCWSGRSWISPSAAPRARHDARDHEHRDRVLVGLGDRRDRVRQARSADEGADARAAGDARPGVGHEAGPLLVARRDVADARLGQPPVELQRVDARDPEDRRGPRALQQLDHRLAAGGHSAGPSVVLLPTRNGDRLTEMLRLATNESPYGPFPAALEAIADAVATIGALPRAGHGARGPARREAGLAPEQIALGNGGDAIIGYLTARAHGSGRRDPHRVAVVPDVRRRRGQVRRHAGAHAAAHGRLRRPRRAAGCDHAEDHGSSGSARRTTRPARRSAARSSRPSSTRCPRTSSSSSTRRTGSSPPGRTIPTRSPSTSARARTSARCGRSRRCTASPACGSAGSPAPRRSRRGSSPPGTTTTSPTLRSPPRSPASTTRPRSRAAARATARTGHGLEAGLDALGIGHLPSDTNFVCAVVDDAPALAAHLAAHGILVRSLDDQDRPDLLRITVGEPAAMDAVLEALRTR